MTDTNNEKETFESYWNKNFKKFEEQYSETGCYLYYFFNMTMLQLKQLHDTDLKLCDKHIHDLKCEINEMFIKLKEKDKEIEANNKYIRNLIFSSNQISMDNKHILEKRVSELQTENEKLNHFCVNLKCLNCNLAYYKCKCIEKKELKK